MHKSDIVAFFPLLGCLHGCLQTSMARSVSGLGSPSLRVGAGNALGRGLATETHVCLVAWIAPDGVQFGSDGLPVGRMLGSSNGHLFGSHRRNGGVWWLLHGDLCGGHRRLLGRLGGFIYVMKGWLQRWGELLRTPRNLVQVCSLHPLGASVAHIEGGILAASSIRG